MVNSRLIKGKMVIKGYTQRRISQLLGISEGTLSCKINNKSPFTLGEIDRICEILTIEDNCEKIEIFLA